MREIPPEALRAATDDYKALIAERIPRSFERRVSWELIATGFLARTGPLLESLTLLVERSQNAHALVLTRVLYEHATTFCWLAIDPEPHVEEWRQWDDDRLKRLHNDARAYGVEVLTPEELKEIGDPAQPRPVPKLAEAVDKHSSTVRYSHPGTLRLPPLEVAA